MSIFFILFFTVYSSLHAYLFIKAWYSFRFRFTAGCIIAVMLACFIAAPLVVRFLENAGHETSARVVAYGGYVWMAFIFLFFVIAISIDVARLSGIVLAKVLNVGTPQFISAHLLFFLIASTAAVAVCTYGFFEAQSIRTERVRIDTSKLPEGLERLTIVQISDVHLGLIIREKRLRDIVKAIRRADPHVLVSTGDLVDGQINDLKKLINMLDGVEPRYGKYAVMGNHEFYAGIEVSREFTEKSGFTLLRGEGVTIEGILNIAGVDDAVSKRYHQKVIEQERAALEGLPRELFTVLLKHRPLVEDSSIGLFDLQLSGHTHNGQIFPFTYLTRLAFPMYAGLHQIEGGALLYVSRGTGTWGPPVRFLAPPEVTVIELIRRK